MCIRDRTGIARTLSSDEISDVEGAIAAYHDAGYEVGFVMYDLTTHEGVGYNACLLYTSPFPVLYDYGYAGGLPLAGSELLCLELLEYALDEGLSLGVHYLSLIHI